MADELRFFPEEYLPNAQSATVTYGQWRKQQPGEYAKWVAFRDAVLRGEQVTPPMMSTKKGRELVAAGKEHMALSRLIAQITPPLPKPGAPPPPPSNSQPPNGWGPPVTISAGGSYTVAAESTVAGTPAVLINTTSPVSITGWVRNLAGGQLIDADNAGASQVTLDHIFAYGSPTLGSAGRFYRAFGFKSITITNCTIENTTGIELSQPIASSTVSIARNKVHNLQGNEVNPATPAGLVQFREVQLAAIDVSWNQVINEYNLSYASDLISVYKSSHVRAHDNYFQGQYLPGNGYKQSSQNAITIENGDGLPPVSNDNQFVNNQVVDCAGGVGFFPGVTNNLATGNRIVRAGYLPDGVTQNGNGYEALFISASAPVNNHMHGNIVGYMGFAEPQGSALARRDGRLDGAPEGDAGEWANNTHMSPVGGIIVKQQEIDEAVFWQQKLSSNNITLGA